MEGFMFLDLFFLFSLSIISISLVFSDAEIVSNIFWIAAIIVVIWFGAGSIMAG